jgi:cell division protein FtsB
MTPGRLVKPLLLVFGVAYLMFHALHGDRGLYALVREQRELREVNRQLSEVKAEREQTELRVSHLRDNSLDLDLLDEQMRRMLGVMKPGEVVMLTGDKS